jgi:Zn-dependent protease
VKTTAVRPSPIFLVVIAVAVVGGVLCTFSSTTALNAGAFLLVVGGWAVSLCLHEFGHAYVAYRGGDHSVRAKGYLNLDIRRYTDPMFSIVLPLLLLAFGGIPLPGGAVWINHHALRSKRIDSLVSLAGPLSNLTLALLLTLVLRVSGMPFTVLYAALSLLALYQVFAFFLNILPIPGLDGWGAIEPWLSPQAKRLGATVRPWAPLVLFVVLFSSAPARTTFFDISDHIYALIGGDTSTHWYFFGDGSYLHGQAWEIGDYFFRFWQR